MSEARRKNVEDQPPTKARLCETSVRQLSFSVKNLDIGFGSAASLIGFDELVGVAPPLL